MAGAATNIRAIAKQVEALPRRVVKDATKTVSKSITKGLKVDTGGDAILSGTTRQGRVGKLTVKAKVTGSSVVTGTVRAGPSGRAIAMWSWLEWGTGEPGPTAAKHTWSRTAEPAMDVAQRNVRRELQQVIGG